MTTRGRRFEFVEGSYQGDVPAISCDGLVPGTALDLTHWQGNHTPGRFKADTSTAIALNFVISPEAGQQWATAVAVNNHFDTDGVLSVWASWSRRGPWPDVMCWSRRQRPAISTNGRSSSGGFGWTRRSGRRRSSGRRRGGISRRARAAS